MLKTNSLLVHVQAGALRILEGLPLIMVPREDRQDRRNR